VKVRESLVGAIAVALAAAVVVPLAARAVASVPVQTVTGIAIGRADVRQIQAANGHVFISAGNVVLVFDGSALVKTIAGQPGADGLLASSDGSTLYVADRAASRISLIDTTTLTETTTYTTAGCPANLTASATRLFYSYGCLGSSNASGLGSVALADGSDNQVVNSIAGSFTYLPAHLSAAGDHLAVIDDGISPATISTFTITGGALTQQATYSGATGRSISLSPDGSLVAFGQMNPYGITVLNFSDLGPNNQMTSGPYPTVVAWSHSGAQLATGLSAPYGPASVDVFSMPDAVLQASALASAPGNALDAISLSYTADDSSLFVLMADSSQAGNAYFIAAATSPSPTATATPTATPTASPTPSQTPSPTPTGVPIDFPPLVDIGAVPARDIAVANGHAFVSVGNTVLVYDGTTLVHTLLGQPGAAGLLASPDESKVYIADSAASRISVIDTTSLTQTTTFATAGCPQNLAATSARLIYTFGCTSSQWSSGIGSVNLSDGTDDQHLTLANGNPFTASAAAVAAAGDHVVFGSLGSSPGTITTYVVSGNKLTKQATTSGSGGDVAISPDGQLVAYGGITVVNFSDLGPNNSMVTGSYPRTVAFSHSGNRIAAGVSGWYDPASLDVYDLPNGILQARSSTPDPGSPALQLNVLKVRFTSDDLNMYLALAPISGGQSYITLASATPGAHPSPTPTPSPTASPTPTGSPSPSVTPTITPSPTATTTPSASPTPSTAPRSHKLSLRAVGVSALGQPLKLTATLLGEPGVQVRFRTSDSTPYVRTVVATTDAGGVARASIPVNHSGTATATVAATDTQPAASVSVFFEVPARVSLSWSRPPNRSGVVNLYHRTSDIHLAVHARPIGVSVVEVRLYRRIAGKWVLRVDQTLKTTPLGDATVRFPTLLKHQIYREVVVVGPTGNNAASPKQSFTFELK
jgi:YVTN family beta-propeller protein